MLFLIFLILYIFVGLCFIRINQRNHKGCPFYPICGECDSDDTFTRTMTVCLWPIETILLIIKLIIRYLKQYAYKLIDIIYDSWENIRSDSED